MAVLTTLTVAGQAHIFTHEMAKPETNRRDVISRLEREGWQLARKKGPHDVYKHAARIMPVVVPRHTTLSIGVAHKIAKNAGWI